MRARSVNDWERQVTAEPRMQARPSGGFTPLLYAARQRLRSNARRLLREGRRRHEPRRSRRRHAAAARDAQLQFRHRGAARAAGRRRQQVGYVGPLAAVRRGGHEHAADRRPRGPAVARQDHAACELIEMLLEAGANPNLQLKLFPPYRSLRDDRGADTHADASARRRCCAPRRPATCAAMKLLHRARRERGPAHGHRHHAADGGGRQRLSRTSTRAAATRPKRRRSKRWSCCWQPARTSTRAIAAARRPCTARRAGAGTAS